MTRLWFLEPIIVVVTSWSLDSCWAFVCWRQQLGWFPSWRRSLPHAGHGEGCNSLTSQFYGICQRLIPGSLAQSLYSSSSNKMESTQFPVLNLFLFKQTQIVSGFCNWNLTNTTVVIHAYSDRIALILWRITGTFPEHTKLRSVWQKCMHYHAWFNFLKAILHFSLFLPTTHVPIFTIIIIILNSISLSGCLLPKQTFKRHVVFKSLYALWLAYLK